MRSAAVLVPWTSSPSWKSCSSNKFELLWRLPHQMGVHEILGDKQQNRDTRGCGRRRVDPNDVPVQHSPKSSTASIGHRSLRTIYVNVLYVLVDVLFCWASPPRRAGPRRRKASDQADSSIAADENEWRRKQPSLCPYNGYCVRGDASIQSGCPHFLLERCE